MDHQKSFEQLNLHSLQHLARNVEDRPQQLPLRDQLPRPSYAPPDGAVRGRSLTGRGLPSICFACFKQLPPKDLVLCYCYHNYCHECVYELVQAALVNDHLHPVRCCDTLIPLDWEALKVPQETINKYNGRKGEIEARETTNCYRNTCRAPIHPQYIQYDEALCTKCWGHTCVHCKKATHEGLACGVRESQGEQRLHDLAVTYGWGKCHHCESYIQLSTGRNHLCKSSHEIYSLLRTNKEER